jgi:hypothetical protein
VSRGTGSRNSLRLGRTSARRQTTREGSAEGQSLDLWLDCFSEREIAAAIGAPQPTINGWLVEKRKDPKFDHPTRNS